MKSLLTAGYLCALVALFFVPPAFGIAALVIGIIVLAKGRVGHGIALIVIAVTCGFAGMYIGWMGLGNLLFLLLPPASQSTQSLVTRPATQDWHVVSIEGRITESDEAQSRYAWKLRIRNDSAQPAVFSGEVDFQDADGFIVSMDNALNMQVSGEGEGVFTGYTLMHTKDAQKVVRTVAKISKER